MNLPDRISSERPLKCCVCGVVLPPAVTVFSIGAGVYCEKCMWKMKELAEVRATASGHPQQGFSGFKRPGEDFDWPEEIDPE